MPYIGKSPSAGVRQRYQYTATASQTTFSGTDLGNLTLTYTDNNFVDVFQNGVLLKGGGTDYTATSGTSVVLATGATADDVIEIIVYDVFSVGNFFNRTDSDSRYVNVSGGTMTGSLDLNGTELVLDADGDTSITADTDDQIDIKIAGSDSVTIKASEIETSGAPFTLSNTSNGNNIDIKTTSSGSLVHALKIHSGGRVEPKQGLLIGGDAAANLLDDYEEGTWTPSLGGNTTYHSQVGKYIKVGNVVHAGAVIQANSLGTGSTTTVSGFPFTSSNAGNGYQGGDIGFYYFLASNVMSLDVQMTNGATTCGFSGRSSAGNTISSTIAVFADGARIDFSVTYYAA